MWPFHTHRYDRRERVKAELHLFCDCGASVPALSRTKTEQKQMHRKYPLPPRVTAQGSRKVVKLRGVR